MYHRETTPDLAARIVVCILGILFFGSISLFVSQELSIPISPISPIVQSHFFPNVGVTHKPLASIWVNLQITNADFSTIVSTTGQLVLNVDHSISIKLSSSDVARSMLPKD